jgi:hypothetical protein
MEICRAEPSEELPGLDIVFTGAAPVEVSERWSVGGWEIEFVSLEARHATSVDQTRGTVHLKVVAGELVDPALGPFPEVGTVRSTVVDAATVRAGDTGAVFAVLTQTSQVGPGLHDMSALGFTGPYADAFVWQTFHERFGGAEVFAGVDAHIVPGFHLRRGDGTEIAYVHFWTMGKGGDASTHNHDNEPSSHRPAFAEIHWVFNNGTGAGGMYACDEPGGSRTTQVMQRGEEHGPMWRIDPDTGFPLHRPNGSVDYGWHGWRGGIDDNPRQSFDFVAAFEINPELAAVG